MKSIDQVEVEQAERRAQSRGVSAAGASSQSAMGGRAAHRRLGALGAHLVASEVEEAVAIPPTLKREPGALVFLGRTGLESAAAPKCSH